MYDKYFQVLHAYHQVRVLDSLAYAHLLAGNYQLSEQYSKKCLDISQGIENDFVEEFLLITRAKAYTIQGFLDQAYQEVTRQLTLGDENNRLHTLISANTILGDIFFTLQNPSRALKYYRIAQIREGFPLKSIQGIENGIALARLLTWIKHLDEAEAILENVLEITSLKGMQSLNSQALIISGYCDLYKGRKEKTKEKFDQAGENARRLGLKYEATWSKKAHARLALSSGEYERAEALLEEALEVSQRHNFMWINLYGWRTYFELMKAKKQISISPEAQANFRKTIQKLEEHTRTYPLNNHFEEAKRKWADG
jgi:tetratricopeptide (TPR) repeat protein